MKTLNIEICKTIKHKSDYSIKLIQIKTTAIKQKDWKKMKLMTSYEDKKSHFVEKKILCMM